MAGKYLICDEENVNIFESVEVEKAWAILFADKERTFSVVQIPPSVRFAIGERFGMHSGEDCMGKIATALRAMGADAVVDSAMGGDVAVLNDAKELKKRKEKEIKKPLFSSKCAAIADYIRAKYPDLDVSPTFSEDSINALLLKNYYRAQTGKTVRIISVQPCADKKFLLNVDCVITANELETMLAEVEDVGVSVRTLPKTPLDIPLGVATGCGYIPDFSGGMAEAVARCLLADKSVESVDKLSYGGLYGLKKRREASVILEGNTFRFAVACGMDEAEALIKEVREGKAEYDYIEITACEGGCVCGKELPIEKEDGDRLRRKSLQAIDKKRSARCADVSLTAMEMRKRYKEWLRKREAGLLEPETDVEPVKIDEGFLPVSIEKEELPIVEEIAIAEETLQESEQLEETVAQVVEEETEEVVVAEASKTVSEKQKCDPYYTRMSQKERRKKKRESKKK